jgi:hypothetical protein
LEQEREKEIYKIYSLLMTNPPTSHGPDDNARYLIAETTSMPVHQQPCVDPPKERRAQFLEAVAEFELKRSTPRKLKRELSLQKPYDLVSSEEAKAFAKARSVPSPHAQAPDPRFKGVSDIFTLGDVYFSKDGKLALTSLSTWCGGLCGLFDWKVFEKLPTGDWKLRPSWVTCFTVAQRH